MTALHSITTLEAEKVVNIGGHELHVLYHPFKITTAMSEHYEKLQQEDDLTTTLHFIIKTLLHIVASWDLSIDEEGTEIIPLEREQLEHLPILLLQEIFNTIVTGLGY